jgi:hypothetical protein
MLKKKNKELGRTLYLITDEPTGESSMMHKDADPLSLLSTDHPGHVSLERSLT